MSLLQFIIIIFIFVFLIFALDAFQRKKLNILHFIVFIWWTLVLILFTFDSDLLNTFWKFFWVARWADIIVYFSIMILWLFYFELLNKQTKNTYKITKFITNDSINRFIDQWWLENIENWLNKIKDSKYNKFLFLIRCYNEESMIWEVIDDLVKFWINKFLIVNDWSSDNSLNILKYKAKQYPDCVITILSHTVNMWWWAANKTWFKFLWKYGYYFKSERVVTYDADGQMDINDLNRFNSYIEKDLSIDVLLWTRFKTWWKAENIPIHRRVILFWSKIITFMFNKLWVTDPHNWYRVIKIKYFKEIKIFSDWMLYASELIDEIKRLWLNFKEVPVNIKYTEYSLWKWQKSGNAFKILFELIYKKLFFK